METKPINRILIAVIAVIVLAGTCSAGFIVGRFSDSLIGRGSTEPAETEELFKPFWQAWDIVNTQYLVQPVDQEALMQGAIRGMLEALGDPHTSYMDPAQFSDANAPLQGYDGIGAYVNTEGEYLTIVEPIPGSPAEAAGLQAGDIIIAVDGEDMTGVLPEVARLKVLGPAGTTVTLTIRRANVELPFDVEITRAHIVIPSVESEVLENDIAYLKLSSFSDTSAEDIHAALEELLAQNPRGLILDLRNNSGGYLDAAVQIASEFLPDGVVAYEEYGDGNRDTYEASGKGIATTIPMVVLVNEWSASASELVAGALQDRGRAELVGVTTYGKGTVQNWIPLANNEGAIRVTIARWLTPNGTSIHENGLTPDVIVEYSVEDMTTGRDPQLERAIELLSQP
jgi:carboxyl-terminal processing protease